MENFKLKDFFVNEDYTKDVNVTNDTSMYDPLMKMVIIKKVL
jgi:hypothetical protein